MLDILQYLPAALAATGLIVRLYLGAKSEQ
jgi:hypothetical protein